MSLRLQLLAFGSLTLVLPWAGLRFVQEMETTQRLGLEASLLASARTVAAVLDADLAATAAASSSGAATIYAQPLAAAPRVDGFRDDWSQAIDLGAELDSGHGYWVGTDERYAYLFFDVRDEDRVYQSGPGRQPYGDRIVLRVATPAGEPRWLLLITSAPGVLRAQLTTPGLFAPLGQFEDRVFGAWRETPDGYSVEVRAPLELLGGVLGIAVIDVDAVGDDYRVTTSTTWPLTETPSVFRYQPAELKRALAPFSRAGDRFRVLDADGWVLSEAGNVAAAMIVPPNNDDLATRFFRALLRREDPLYTELERPIGHLGDLRLRSVLEGEEATAWFRRGPEGSAIVAAAVPIVAADGVRGAVLLEQASDAILSLADQALLRLMSFTVLASIVAAVGLLSFATWLSFRVRRLARAAEFALGPKGEIETRLPGARARDEIGDLSRSFSDLLKRLREHTQYLRTLTSKLSHELRTPLAIMTTSLDNLEQERDAAAAAQYLQRLRDGSVRLDAIVVAMSEATRIEQAIGESETEQFELDSLLRDCCGAYRDVYPEVRIVYRLSTDASTVRGSKDLLAQLLDKLVDNAVGFSPVGAEVGVELSANGDELCLAVENRGSRLPEAMRDELFQSLVSFRESSTSGRPHLGLGLYVVALITEFHAGRAEAENLPDAAGVVFKIWLPRVKRRR